MRRREGKEHLVSEPQPIAGLFFFQRQPTSLSQPGRVHGHEVLEPENRQAVLVLHLVAARDNQRDFSGVTGDHGGFCLLQGDIGLQPLRALAFDVEARGAIQVGAANAKALAGHLVGELPATTGERRAADGSFRQAEVVVQVFGDGTLVAVAFCFGGFESHSVSG